MDKHSGTLECLSTARAPQNFFCNLVLTKGLLGAIIKVPKGKERKEMRTCNACGCYVPDNWKTCPACHNTYVSVIRNNHKNSDITVFKVNVMNRNEIIAKEFFGLYGNAYSYAQRKVKEVGVSHTEIVRDGIILNYFSK
jgi:hypothetical protein